MTISPYDNLPLGNTEKEPLGYVDVEISPDPPLTVEAVPVKKPQPVSSERARLNPAPPKPAKTVPLAPPPQYSTLNFRNLCGCYEYVLPFEESLLVPDTMPDMQKVLFAEGKVTPALPAKASYDRNDFLSGDITVYIVYKPVPTSPSPSAGPAAYNDCPVDVVKSVIPFKTDKCWESAEGDTFRTSAAIRSISAEMINERKFIVRGELLIKMTGIADCEGKIFKGAQDDELVTAGDTIAATVLEHETSDVTEISQEITIREGRPSPVKILKTSLDIVENHRQITSGKLVINATIHCHILYLGETDSGEKELCCQTNKTDFTQFIVMDDKTDPDLIRLTFSGGDLKLTIENKDKFMLQGNVTTLIQSYRNKEIDVVKDAYHKKKELCFDIISHPVNLIRETVSGEISAREVVDLSDGDKRPADLLCGSCRVSSIEGRPEKGRIVIEGDIPVKILALDDEKAPMVIDHKVPIRGAIAMSASEATAPSGRVSLDESKLSFCIDAAVKEFWFNEINSRQIEINTALTITVWVSGEEDLCTIDGLCFAEEGYLPKRASMAIYVVGSGDTLWDVAKRYKTDAASIAALNDLDPAKPLPEGAKLFLAK